MFQKELHCDIEKKTVFCVQLGWNSFQINLNFVPKSEQEHRELAREAVRKSLVLLKNGNPPEQQFLPLPKRARSILVAGSHASNLGYQCGGWSIKWMGGSGDITTGNAIHHFNIYFLTKIAGTLPFN